MKAWLVTGGSRGLGRGLVEGALEAGDRVPATARNPELLWGLRDTYGGAVLPLDELGGIRLWGPA
jgi:NAD(P)-dependent dehydrogenase (short-subunit alcohol dehydrogenase family)